MIQGISAKTIKEKLHYKALFDRRIWDAIRANQRKPKPHNPEQTVLGTDTWLNSSQIEEALLALIDQRSHLRKNVAVLPSFSETIFKQLLSKFIKEKSGKCLEEKSLMKMYLQMLFEHDADPKLFRNEAVSGLKREQWRQWILPFHINGNHFTVAVILFDKAHHCASIQYYDSFGRDLDPMIRDNLVAAFSEQGYKVLYRCMSKPDQKDAFNCGPFSYLAAISMASKNVGKTENFFDHLEAHYQPLMNYHRSEFVKIMNGLGHHYIESDELAAAKKLNPKSYRPMREPAAVKKPPAETFNAAKVAAISACLISVCFLPVMGSITVLAGVVALTYFMAPGAGDSPIAIKRAKHCELYPQENKPLAESSRSALTFRQQRLPKTYRRVKEGGVDVQTKTNKFAPGG